MQIAWHPEGAADDAEQEAGRGGIGASRGRAPGRSRGGHVAGDVVEAEAEVGLPTSGQIGYQIARVDAGERGHAAAGRRRTQQPGAGRLWRQSRGPGIAGFVAAGRRGGGS